MEERGSSVYDFLLDPNILQFCVEEFAQSLSEPQKFELDDIIQARNFRDERCIFLLSSEVRKIAIKFDKTSPTKGHLKREFERLLELDSYFQNLQNFDVIKPLYLSDSGLFFVTEQVQAPTAIQAVREPSVMLPRTDVYRRAGEWLHHMHSSGPQEVAKFWPGWLMKRINDPQTLANTLVKPEVYEPLMDHITACAHKARGNKILKCVSHGDFHGNNLLMSEAVTYGLDLTAMGVNFAVHDITKLFMMDVVLDADAASLDKSGIVAQHTQAFFDAYKHPIDAGVLGFCVKARMLITLLRTTAQSYAASKYQQRKFGELLKRVQFACK